jgi:hypothetical protein
MSLMVQDLRALARPVRGVALTALVALALAGTATAAGGGAGLSGGSTATSGSSGGTSSGPTGGAAIGGVAPTKTRHVTRIPPPPSKHDHGRWMTNFTLTEYWPAPERWFKGALVNTPGLPTRHRIDWLYSAMGLSMEGEGIGLDGRMYHIDALGDGGWVTVDGKPTSPSDGWSAGSPFWRAGGFWRNGSGGVTFPLAAGGWYAGAGRKYVPLNNVSFATGGASRLRFYQSVAVDPNVVPMGSRVYIPAYRHDGHGGWFIAQDTGGAINGHHVDVYRSPPPSPNTGGQYMTGQRVYVIKPRKQ